MPTPSALRVANRQLTLYRHVWRANLMAAFVQPMLYLLGIGIGVGTLIERGPENDALLGNVSYFAFYATALLATTAMFTGSQEALWPTLDGFQWSNAYRAMIATPIEPRDVASGLACYFAVRAVVGGFGVGVVLALFDDTRGLGIVPAVGAAILTSLAFALPIAAWTSTRETDESFPAILRFGLIPMFLFGGAFYPIEQLPDWLEPVALATPLYHGIELCRGLVLGTTTDARMVVHTVVLIAFATLGWAICTITFARRLRP